MKYLFLFLSLLIFACEEQDKILVAGKDGLLYEQGSTVPFTGIEKGYVHSKFLEYEVVNGEKHGYFKVSDSLGHIETYGYISHNKYEGQWKYFYPNGKIESSGYFRNDQPSGEWKWFYPNGIVKQVGKYFEGREEGEWRYFSQSGELMMVKIFKEGQIVEEKKIPDNKL